MKSGVDAAASPAVHGASEQDSIHLLAAQRGSGPRGTSGGYCRAAGRQLPSPDQAWTVDPGSRFGVRQQVRTDRFDQVITKGGLQPHAVITDRYI